MNPPTTLDRTFIISVPPAQYKVSKPSLRADVMYPNKYHPYPIRAPAAILEAIKKEMPTITDRSEEDDSGETLSLWSTVNVIRDSQNLGYLEDLRLALQFSMNEVDFQRQLTFAGGRERKLTVDRLKAGYAFPCHHLLLSKILIGHLMTLVDSTSSNMELYTLSSHLPI
jgi:hypothetical protein